MWNIIKEICWWYLVFACGISFVSQLVEEWPPWKQKGPFRLILFYVIISWGLGWLIWFPLLRDAVRRIAQEISCARGKRHPQPSL